MSDATGSSRYRLDAAVDWLRAYMTRQRQITLLLAVVVGVAVYAIGEGVFPSLTQNHDEAVYLQQAEMLLDGRLKMRPPVEESFRPWFFVADGGEIYPKYTPVTAAFFAVGGLLGSYRLSLAVIAALAIVLMVAVVSEVFDERTGLIAAGLLAVSPLFVVQATVFLPYIPAFTLNLLFAWAYLRGTRTESRRFAALAGGAIGLSFWARPYTAMLFAAPFVCHALWTMRALDREVILRQSVTAALGLAGVGVALAYNAVMTGDPLLFPYEAFAPRDGPGFGQREITGYEREYTPSLALEANARNLWHYGTRWTPAGVVGTAAAIAGLLTVAGRPEWRRDPRVLALFGLLVTIPLGNLYFWGTLNVLGNLSDPNDGLIAVLGPYYHVGLLLPTVTAGALGVQRAVELAAGVRDRTDSQQIARVVTATFFVTGTVLAGVTGAAVVAPLSENYEATQQYENAYEPFDDREFENGLVFLPTPYDDWLNHPFQMLRNDPDYEGEVVYSLQHREFEVVDAFPERTLYRYTFRGEWLPFLGQSVEPRLREIDHVSGEAVTLDLSLGLPEAVEIVEVRASVDGEGDSTASALPNDGIDVNVTAADGAVDVQSASFEENLTVAHDGESPVRLVTFVDYGALGGFEYVVTLPLQEDGEYRALTPYMEVCEVPSRCGGAAAYIPGEHRAGVWMEASLSASDE